MNAAQHPTWPSLADSSQNIQPSPSLTQLPVIPSKVSSVGKSEFHVKDPSALKKAVSGVQHVKGYAAVGKLDTAFSQLKGKLLLDGDRTGLVLTSSSISCVIYSER
jgi:hypothetical protein